MWWGPGLAPSRGHGRDAGNSDDRALGDIGESMMSGTGVASTMRWQRPRPSVSRRWAGFRPIQSGRSRWSLARRPGPWRRVSPGGARRPCPRDRGPPPARSCRRRRRRPRPARQRRRWRWRGRCRAAAAVRVDREEPVVVGGEDHVARLVMASRMPRTSGCDCHPGIAADVAKGGRACRRSADHAFAPGDGHDRDACRGQRDARSPFSRSASGTHGEGTRADPRQSRPVSRSRRRSTASRPLPSSFHASRLSLGEPRHALSPSGTGPPVRWGRSRTLSLWPRRRQRVGRLEPAHRPRRHRW